MLKKKYFKNTIEDKKGHKFYLLPPIKLLNVTVNAVLYKIYISLQNI